MKQSSFMILCGAVLMTGAACSGPSAPATAVGVPATNAAAGASGETLKTGAPAVIGPTGSVQLQTATVVLSWQAVTGRFASFTPSYQIELRDAAGTLVANPTVTGTSYTVTATLALDSVHTWRVRATYQDAVGPWSSTATFKTQVAAFISGNTIYDPLSTGITVGTRIGPTSFVANQGLKLEQQTSYVRYNLPTTLIEGEMSMLILGADEGNPGDKSKVFAMQEGTDEFTDNDYRMSVELRGRDYSTPGAVTCRIITGAGGIYDCPRIQLGFTSTRWYFWRFAWQTGQARLTVRLDNESGSVIYDQTISTGSRQYRPTPHTVYLGAPPSRAGVQDGTIGGGPIYRNFWTGPTARPSFPAVLERLLDGGR